MAFTQCPGSSWQVPPFASYGWGPTDSAMLSAWSAACNTQRSGNSSSASITQTNSISTTSAVSTSTSANYSSTINVLAITTPKPSLGGNNTSTSTATIDLTSGRNSSSSSPASAPIPTTSSSAVLAGTKNINAVVGGVIGGLGLLCLIVFGVLILRKVQRSEDRKPKRNRSWWRFRQNTAMQTGGLHEKAGTAFWRYEKDGQSKIIHEKEGDGPRRQATELSAETIFEMEQDG
ncbi:uncharacterized protein LY89DRAFT_230274 [Mollisia scopiformis]|uniref:Mid2 domain-containing protein n=1 Tax=Mollisia scopiformis TaxID=149040 RepID=A0A194WUS0_MOLSC|nr:uncharacterized protein LY89DRAFT_230274 [Mollisia scopiformis]KUJ11713.1 hypothetical protein LY89DRAFT_230274 [Mollisia scopiformis]